MPEEKKPEEGNGELKPPEQIKQEAIDAQKKKGAQQVGQGIPPKDYKIAEIWIKDGTVALDASPNFWIDKLRAIGILHYCEKIVDDFNPQDRKRIIRPPASGLGGFRNPFRKKR